MRDDESFYIGYLPQAPAPLARWTRRTVAVVGVGALALAVGIGLVAPYYGQGTFAFGQTREFAGTLRCAGAPRLTTPETDYVLVGYGKRGVVPEICGADGSEVTLRGSLIQRDGRQLVEVADLVRATGPAAPGVPATALGRFTLTGEIVDAKCYFGVMNPGEGRLHRACAVQCLRGGVPAVFVAHDQTGATATMLLSGASGGSVNDSVLRWVGERVQATGELFRQGRWLVWRVDPASLRLAGE